MYALLNRFLRRRDGVAAVEFAMVTPVFLLMFLSVTELGNMIYYSIAIEKGMRSGVTYAARNNVPLTEEVIANSVSLAKTGAFPATNAPYLVAGYGESGASVDVSTSTFTDKVNGTDINVVVVRLEVNVPYVPLLPGITDEILGGDPSINLVHEQAIIGD